MPPLDFLFVNNDKLKIHKKHAMSTLFNCGFLINNKRHFGHESFISECFKLSSNLYFPKSKIGMFAAASYIPNHCRCFGVICVGFIQNVIIVAYRQPIKSFLHTTLSYLVH